MQQTKHVSNIGLILQVSCIFIFRKRSFGSLSDDVIIDVLRFAVNLLNMNPL